MPHPGVPCIELEVRSPSQELETGGGASPLFPVVGARGTRREADEQKSRQPLGTG